jgi:micrococcal nuclease
LLGQNGLGQLTLVLALTVALGGCDGSDPAEPSGERVPARVTRHTDGDTLWLSGIGKVRLIGVDTPEVYGGAECYGREASAFVKRLLPLGSSVGYTLGTDERDRYGRALAYVYTEDGRSLNLLLVRRGYAQPLTIPPNDELAERFVAAARRARARRVGLWAAGACL